MAMNALSYSDIAAYFSLVGERPTPHELGIIRKLDGVACKVASDSVKAAAKKKPRTGK